MRNIEEYTKEYLKEGFESWQVRYRRKKILKILSKYPHRRILEIGCGMEPLFCWMNEDSFQNYTVVEPSRRFYDNAKILAEGKENIRCIHETFLASEGFVNEHFDFILCSSLLHEVENPISLLKEIHKVCYPNTVLHINVPNANSFHRLLAKQMGLLQDTHELSERNIIYQQHTVFTLEDLTKLLLSVGFSVMESGSYFLKPFTHNQMYEMLQKEILNEKILDGLYNLGECIEGEMGSEIYVNAEIA